MMKAGIAILLLCYAVEVVSSFQLYESMQETRNAIMSFYDPDDVKADDEPLESEINWHKETSIHEIAEPEFSEDEKDDFKALPRDHKFSVLEKPWERPKIGKGPKVAEERTTGVSSLGFRQPVPLPTAPRARPTLKSLPKPISTRVTKKSKPVTSKKRVSLNKFSEALEDIEKALADAQVVRRVNHNEQRLRRLRDLIKTAVEKRSYRFARKAIGEAMYTIKKINEQRKSGGRSKRNTVLSSKDFLGSVRQTIGVSAFNNLFAMQGQVTLMFAIDDTGSMRDEIAAVKKIASSIVNQQRAEFVDYILSPFNDPETGPVTYCNETETDKFVKAIASLSPYAGGDCRELTFKGMSDAIHEGPYPDSPLYVFTDAGPKDATDENILYLKVIANCQGIVVNFFVAKNTGCSKNANLSSFHEIAEATMGQVFELKDHKELEQLEGLTASSLGGTAVVANAVHVQTSRKKRSLSKIPGPISITTIDDSGRSLFKTPDSYPISLDDSERSLSKTSDSYPISGDDSERSLSKTSASYSISVDDSIDTLVVSVTADHSTAGGITWSASLISPTGTITGASANSLDQGTVYQISKPNVGIWSLGITADSNVNYDFMVKASSTDNIDFEYYFVRTTVKRGESTTVPIAAPLQGVEAEAILTLGGVVHVDQRTLKAELITSQGDVIKTSKPVSFTSKDKQGIRHSFKFYPPNQVFKIKLKGKTKKGNPFERICHSPIKPGTLLIQILFARNDYTIPQGGTDYVIFTIENFGNDDVVDITSFGSLGTVERQSRKFSRVRKGRKTSFSVRFRGNAKATKGVTVTIVVSVKGRISGSKSVMSVPLLVV